MSAPGLTPDLEAALGAFDGSGSEAELAAIARLKAEGDGAPPPALAHLAYKRTRSWKGRATCVVIAVPGAERSAEAVAFARQALTDRSWVVRHRACLLAAATLEPDMLPLLESLGETADDRDAPAYAAAADAIRHANVNYFVDPEHTGQHSVEVHL